MATRGEVYVDTSAFVAFLDRSDSHHALFRRLFSKPPALVTSPLVIAEGHGWFLRRFDRQMALRFLLFVEELAPLEVLAGGEAEQKGAMQTLRRFSDQDLTLADAMGLHLMKVRRITTCWSTDFHLGLSGAIAVGRSRKS